MGIGSKRKKSFLFLKKKASLDLERSGVQGVVGVAVSAGGGGSGPPPPPCRRRRRPDVRVVNFSSRINCYRLQRRLFVLFVFYFLARRDRRQRRRRRRGSTPLTSPTLR